MSPVRPGESSPGLFSFWPGWHVRRSGRRVHDDRPWAHPNAAVRSGRRRPSAFGTETRTMTTWQLDPSHTSAEFSVKHMMFTTVRGRFKELSGTIQVDESNPENSSV